MVLARVGPGGVDGGRRLLGRAAGMGVGVLEYNRPDLVQVLVAGEGQKLDEVVVG